MPDEPTPHVFFASYATLDNPLAEDDREGPLGRVVKALRERVRAKRGDEAAEAVGFFAQSTIKTASEWKDVLGNALCRSRVIVCLCSPTFFNSEWCAREFDVFRRRMSAAGDLIKGAKLVLPVIWEPLRATNPMPAVVQQFQLKDDRLPVGYPKLGLYTLSRLKGKADDYTLTLEALADTIVEAGEGPALPVLGQLPDLETLARSFHNPANAPDAYNVAIGFLHDDGPNWKPAGSDVSAARIVEAVCAKLKFPWRELPTGLDLKTELEEAAKRREAVILLLDSESAGKPKWKALIAQTDQLPCDHAAVLLGWLPPAGRSDASVAELDDAFRKLLPVRSKTTSFDSAFALTSSELLKTRLEETVVTVRLALINADPARKVENNDLEQAAKSEGIPVDTRPSLSGPGGSS